MPSEGLGSTIVPVADDLALRYWRAVASLPVDRRAALAELAACFAEGGAVEELDGPTNGRLLATTVGYGLDPLFRGLASIWMPWKGKVFDASAKAGRNLFDPSFRLPLRTLWPSYREDRTAEGGRIAAFRFSTWSGPGRLDPAIEVGKIDYDLPESPGFLIRDILDEIVRIEDGVYLGQALLRWRGAHRRVAWFQLRR